MAVVEKKGVSRASAGCHTSTMSEVVNALVAFAVIVFIFRWATSGHPSSFPRCSPSPLPRSLVLLRHAVRRSRTRLQAKARHPRHGMALPSPLDAHSPPPGRPDPHHVPRHPDVRTPAPARTRRLTRPPRDNIRFDLLRTGSVELTSNKILERGFLEPVPPFLFFFLDADSMQPSPRRPTLPSTLAPMV